MTESSSDAAAAHPLPSPKERRRLREAKPLSEEQVATVAGATRTKSTAPETWPKAAAERAAHPATPTTVARPSEPVTSTKQPRSRPPTPVEAAGSAAMAPTEPGTTPELPDKYGASGTSVTGSPSATGATPETPEMPEASEAPAKAFDALYKSCAAALFHQTFLLTGRRNLSQESVARAFARAWEHWPEVAVDRDPAGWVRAAAYEYALSPWHRLRRSHRPLDPPPAEPGAHALLDALLDLPPSYRRTLLLYDGVGLDLPETAAETEASTPATASRLMNARAAVAERLPEPAEPSSPTEQSALLRQQLGALARAQPPASLPSPDAIRTDTERKAQVWTRAAVSFTVLLVALTLFTLATAPTRYETPESPAQQVGGVPPRGGPQKLTPQDLNLQKKLQGELVQGPARLVPDAG
ncbi:RNA polymerase sigma factor [Streptomyces sp. NPDC056930]|uniref:RNA polymerase sigma factor n=1 Tax=Streptomyces sp. NPDC056930 TaxID=3345967 RepID=UPI00362B7923